MPKELNENMNKELKEIRKMIFEQNENINKETEIIKDSKRNSGAEKYKKMN